MPKRIVDGDSIATSQKLREVQPFAYRAEYALLVTLALANGSFECSPAQIWSRMYSFNRPDVFPDTVKSILDEYERVKLLFRWHEPDGKEWGYWVGIEKEGRLPPPSQRIKMVCGKTPPTQQLREFLHPRTLLGAVLGQSSLGLVGVGLGLVGNTSKPAADAAVCSSPENLLAIYDQKRGSLPGVRELSPQRLSKCRQRLLNHKVETQKFLADFEQSVEHASRIGWPTWTPTFDWFIANDTNYLKVLEGNYDKWALTGSSPVLSEARVGEGNRNPTPEQTEETRRELKELQEKYPDLAGKTK